MPYSLLSSPDDLSCYEVAVLLESQGKGGSKYLHQQSQVGDRLQISPPQNYFPLVNMASRPQHLIAGGIGITPFLAQRFELAAGAADWQLHYLAKQPEQMAFYSQLSESPDTKHLHFYFSQAGSPFPSTNYSAVYLPTAKFMFVVQSLD